LSSTTVAEPGAHATMSRSKDRLVENDRTQRVMSVQTMSGPQVDVSHTAESHAP
jgi:hypothetical protein